MNNNLQRFLTIEKYNGEIRALHESEAPNGIPLEEGDAEWVWQWASSKEEAIDQHYEKHEGWSEDNNSGQPIKDTY